MTWRIVTHTLQMDISTKHTVVTHVITIMQCTRGCRSPWLDAGKPMICPIPNHTKEIHRTLDQTRCVKASDTKTWNYLKYLTWSIMSKLYLTFYQYALTMTRRILKKGSPGQKVLDMKKVFNMKKVFKKKSFQHEKVFYIKKVFHTNKNKFLTAI